MTAMLAHFEIGSVLAVIINGKLGYSRAASILFYGFVTKSRILSVVLVILDGLFSGRLFGVLLARSVIKCVKFTDVSQKCTFLSHFPWCFGRKIVHVLGWLSGPDWMALAGRPG